VPTLDDCYPWQPDGCEWTIRYLWRSMSSVGRLDVIVLALMLVYLFAVVTNIYYRYCLARRVPRVDSADSKKLVAALNIKVGSLKSIALTAPCLGLAGTCFGILSAFGGVGMEKHAALLMITTRIALALIPTAVAIPVAVLATSSYNYICTRMDLLAGEVFEEGQERGRHFPTARRFPPTERFAELPALGLLAALGLTVLVKVFIPSASFRPPTGFYVELASARCDGDDRLIVLHITDAGKLYLNLEQEDWNTLANRLSQIYSLRKHRTLYLLADADVPFQTVADTLDTVDKLDIQVQLVTPKVFNTHCLLKPVVTGSSH
jgi:biopolymer transport protein ExbD